MIVCKDLQLSKKCPQSYGMAGVWWRGVTDTDRSAALGHEDRPLLRRISGFQPSAEGTATQAQKS